MILNLGCGSRPLAGAVNHDKIKHASFVDVVHDLNNYPWPWGDSSCEIIYLIDVLEHLDDVIKALEEVHRLLIGGGVAHIEVPSAGDIRSYRDPTHKHWFTRESFDYFIPGTFWEQKYGFYSPMRWKLQDYHTSPEGDNLYFILEKLI